MTVGSCIACDAVRHLTTGALTDMNLLIDPQAWIRGLLGGALIGIAASLLLLFNGRIAGISGVLGGLLYEAPRGDRRWRLRFILGLIAGAAVLAALRPEFAAPAPGSSIGVLVVAGLLVGFGTRLGNGCTSGHGVCGLARFSRRSLAATLSFMASGFITVYVVRHLLGGL